MVIFILVPDNSLQIDSKSVVDDAATDDSTGAIMNKNQKFQPDEFPFSQKKFRYRKSEKKNQITKGQVESSRVESK